MKIVFENKRSSRPLVSIVLLDWSVRESYHLLDYLANQTVPRKEYEVLWVEYFDKHPAELSLRLQKSIDQNLPPPVDKWIVVGMPKETYYHKHLLYNIGILASSGWILTFCDSDAMVHPTFVQSIIKKFKGDNNIVLHMDQFRNNNKKFYPFNYPSFEEVRGKGCINNMGGKPRGIVDKSDPLHLKNYGACMAALREDLIAIGGADEHIDYLGHVCGPYEMTFRLINNGKKEVWHETEWLYHTYHPGQAGDNDYFGPHDGSYMSTTALEVRKTGRILPLAENPSIKKLRFSPKEVSNSLVSQAIPEANRLKAWRVSSRLLQKWEHVLNVIDKISKFESGDKKVFGKALLCIRTIYLIFKLITRNIFIKATTKDTYDLLPVHGGKWKIPLLTYKFFTQKFQYFMYATERCHRCLSELVTQGVNEAAVFGSNDVSEILYFLTRIIPIKISAIYDSSGSVKPQEKKFLGIDILPMEAMNSYKGKIIVADLNGAEEGLKALNKIGVDRKRIVFI